MITTLVVLAVLLSMAPAHLNRRLFLVVLIGSFIILLTDIMGILNRPKVKRP